jgi:hypothetical protein
MSFVRNLLYAASTLTIATGVVSALAAPPSDYRRQGHHVHGAGELNLALDADNLYLELRSPAASVVGFEHPPSNQADHAALDNAVAILEQGERLFGLSPAAGCRLQSVDVASALIDGDRDGGHAHWPGQDMDTAAGHHGHDDTTHSDITATYRFVCDHPDQLQQADIGLFEAFPPMQHLEIQFIIGARQGGADLDRSNHVLRF